MEHTIISLDKALEFVGDNSTYQKRVMILFSIQWVLYSFFMMGLPFLFATPLFLCPSVRSATDSSTNIADIIGNMTNNESIGNGSDSMNGSLGESIEYYSCFEAEACETSGVQIDSLRSDPSMTEDFELYCGRRIWIAICESLFFLGSTLGSILLALISDHKGRKFAIVISLAIIGVSIILIGISINIYMVLAFLTVAGLGLGGFETISYVYLSEISAERFRNISLVSLTSVWAMAQIIYTPISYFIGNWRLICIFVIGLPFLVSFFLALRFLVETPRYLFSKKRYQDTRNILNSIAIYNRRPRFLYLLEGEIDLANFSSNDDFKLLITESDPYAYKKNYNYLDILRYPSLRKITFFMFLLWFFRYFTYFGLSFSLVSFGAELHQNFLLTAISELLACLISAPIKFKFTRVKTLFLFTVFSSFFSVIVVFFSIPATCYPAEEGCYEKTLSVIFLFIIRFSISTFSSLLITYTGEIYPTVVRSLGYGVALSLGKSVSVAMPYIVNLIQMREMNPLFSFGCVGFFVSIFITRMTETYGKNLPNYVAEHRKKKVNEFNSIGSKESLLDEFSG